MKIPGGWIATLALALSLNAYADCDAIVKGDGAAEDVIRELVRLGATVDGDFSAMQNDLIAPEMAVLENPKPDPNHPHEEITARDYARFVLHRRGRRFLFMAAFRGRSVPIVDGVLLASNGRPLANVSLKFSSFQHTKPNRWRLLESLRNRLDLNRDFALLEDPMSWFKAVTTRQNDFPKLLNGKYFPAEIARVNDLAAILGLFRRSRRELRTVVDMRGTGYAYGFCNEPAMRAAIDDLVGEVKTTGATLTLLWDDTHVLEFFGTKHQLIPVEKEFGFRPKVNLEPTSMSLQSRDALQEKMASMKFTFRGRDHIDIQSFEIRAGKYESRGLEKFMVDQLLERHPHIHEVQLPIPLEVPGSTRFPFPK